MPPSFSFVPALAQSGALPDFPRHAAGRQEEPFSRRSAGNFPIHKNMLSVSKKRLPPLFRGSSFGQPAVAQLVRKSAFSRQCRRIRIVVGGFWSLRHLPKGFSTACVLPSVFLKPLRRAEAAALHPHPRALPRIRCSERPHGFSYPKLMTEVRRSACVILTPRMLPAADSFRFLRQTPPAALRPVRPVHARPRAHSPAVAAAAAYRGPPALRVPQVPPVLLAKA